MKIHDYKTNGDQELFVYMGYNINELLNDSEVSKIMVLLKDNSTTDTKKMILNSENFITGTSLEDVEFGGRITFRRVSTSSRLKKTLQECEDEEYPYLVADFDLSDL